MDYAYDLTRQVLVKALGATRHPGYVCPTCNAEVVYNGGDIKVPYFSHKSGKASPDCDLYHPGSGPGGYRDHPTHSDPPLYLHFHDDQWLLYIVLTPLAGADSRYSTPSELLSAGLELQQKGSPPYRLSASVLWPGHGGNTIPVRPSRHERRINSTGKWPARVKRTRWQQVLGGIPPRGALFVSVRGGAFRRYDWSTPVFWGDGVVLVSGAEARPPSHIHARRMPSKTIEGTEWFAWSITLPSKSNQSVRSWLDIFGVTIETRHNRTRVLTPPMEYGSDGVPHFFLGDPIAAVPAAEATVIAAHSGTMSAVRVARSRGRALIYAIRAVESGPMNIRTNASRDSTHLQVITETSVPMDNFAPAWSVVYGDTRIYPYTTHHANSRTAPLKIMSDIRYLGFQATAHYSSNREDRLHSGSMLDVTGWLAAHLANAAYVTIDAGNLGHVRINFTTSSQVAPTADVIEDVRDRPTWETAYAIASDAASDPTLPHWRVRNRNVRPARRKGRFMVIEW